MVTARRGKVITKVIRMNPLQVFCDICSKYSIMSMCRIVVETTTLTSQ